MEFTRYHIELAYAHGMRDFSELDLSGADLRWADLSGADLRWADLSGADLYKANLCGADLSYANLKAANLWGAQLHNVYGLYSVFAPRMSSRGDYLFGDIVGGQLRFSAGCKRSISAAELRDLVRATHGDNSHARQYEAAIAFIETCYAIDAASGMFIDRSEETHR